MPYSDLLMTLIFIKRLCDRAGAGGDLGARRRLTRCRKGAPMWAELRRWTSGAAVAAGTTQPNTCVSTLSLCNANFGPRLA